MNDESNAQVILEAGMTLGEPKQANIDGLPYTVLPSGAQVVNLEKMLKDPARKRAHVTCRELPSFARYLEDHGTAATAIFATLDENNGFFHAIIDYHEPKAEGRAGWGEHTIRFNPLWSAEHLRWKKQNGQWIGQTAFAEWLQDNTGDITAPDGATILEIARELVAKKNVNFRSAVVLKDGTTQFTYEETMTTAGGAKGHLEVPERFAITIPIHQAGPRYVLEARLRYKIDEGRLAFRYDLVQLHKVIDQVNGELLNAVKTATKREVFIAALNS